MQDGIVIGCRTNVDIPCIGSYTQSLVLTMNDGEYTTTESGIYINVPSPNKTDNIDSTSNTVKCTPSSMTIPGKGDSSIKFAAFILFETVFWKLATILLR